MEWLGIAGLFDSPFLRMIFFLYFSVRGGWVSCWKTSLKNLPLEIAGDFFFFNL